MQKRLEIKSNINLLQRFFNVVAYVSPTPIVSQKDICITSPALAQLEEVVLILNPMYNDEIEDVIELLVRSGF